MRFYDLDSNGWPRASFARKQNERDLPLLPDQPDEYHRWDGRQWVEQSAHKLAEIEAHSLGLIDANASDVRTRFITSGDGQDGTYIAKRDEARAYQHDSDPTAADYPWLEAEAARRGMTISALADEVLARQAAWVDAGKRIEAERVGGKADVRAASTAGGKRTAADNAIAALDRIRPA